MTRFTKGEYVLINNGAGSYVVKKIVEVRSDNIYLISHGAYSTEYHGFALHKCPKSLIPKEVA